MVDLKIVFFFVYFYFHKKGKEVHGKNDIIKISKTLIRYESENNFIRPSK